MVLLVGSVIAHRCENKGVLPIAAATTTGFKEMYQPALNRCNTTSQHLNKGDKDLPLLHTKKILALYITSC